MTASHSTLTGPTAARSPGASWTACGRGARDPRPFWNTASANRHRTSTASSTFFALVERITSTRGYARSMVEPKQILRWPVWTDARRKILSDHANPERVNVSNLYLRIVQRLRSVNTFG